MAYIFSRTIYNSAYLSLVGEYVDVTFSLKIELSDECEINLIELR